MLPALRHLLRGVSRRGRSGRYRIHGLGRVEAARHRLGRGRRRNRPPRCQGSRRSMRAVVFASPLVGTRSALAAAGISVTGESSQSEPDRCVAARSPDFARRAQPHRHSSAWARGWTASRASCQTRHSAERALLAPALRGLHALRRIAHSLHLGCACVVSAAILSLDSIPYAVCCAKGELWHLCASLGRRKARK